MIWAARAEMLVHLGELSSARQACFLSDVAKRPEDARLGQFDFGQLAQTSILCVCCVCVCCVCVGPFSHDSPRTPDVHISGPRRFKHHQNSTKGPQREKERKIVVGEGKKARNVWPPTLRGPTLRAPTLLGPTLTGPPGGLGGEEEDFFPE